ncbi:sulfate adenylyltransferase subunit 1 [Kutzneria sp. CA-103260]|uniref:sulfate adenylyltransferase subunit 1 n=1 Tax=Kutzneria sp. CA-103260 TaxID=2802641 RepID=UPI001BA7500F|nr:GTP-binding protein [Kutzneria sp. CA-103260]QUQ63547.1 sulfate adenylyltransferase [Kutzneria sp. CA-103260]
MTTTESVPVVDSARGDLLRLATAGSVDDGKSTLVGRLLHDTSAVLPDQLDAVRRASLRRGLADTDLALLTDGLRAEREQGITIDVAYRYFATARRRFILADTPGHVQYTRNMVTGASTAELAVILVDARHGFVEQTGRHTVVSALLRVPHVVLAVNKMDLVGYAEDRFAEIAGEFTEYAGRLGLADVRAIPISALCGDNVVAASPNMSWHTGPTLLEHLETVETQDGLEATRLPVQYVIRAGDFRGYAGQLSAGVLRAGDEVAILPSGRRTRITGLYLNGMPVDEAFAPQSVVVGLADAMDVARGDLIAPVVAMPDPVDRLRVVACQLSARPLRAGDRVLLRHTTRTVRAVVESITQRLDVHSLSVDNAMNTLHTNDIAVVSVRTAEPVAADSYADNRHCGSVLLIDEATGDTLTAGMVGLPPWWP